MRIINVLRQFAKFCLLLFYYTYIRILFIFCVPVWLFIHCRCVLLRFFHWSPSTKICAYCVYAVRCIVCGSGCGIMYIRWSDWRVITKKQNLCIQNSYVCLRACVSAHINQTKCDCYACKLQIINHLWWHRYLWYRKCVIYGSNFFRMVKFRYWASSDFDTLSFALQEREHPVSCRGGWLTTCKKNSISLFGWRGNMQSDSHSAICSKNVHMPPVKQCTAKWNSFNCL